MTGGREYVRGCVSGDGPCGRISWFPMRRTRRRGREERDAMRPMPHERRCCGIMAVVGRASSRPAAYPEAA